MVRFAPFASLLCFAGAGVAWRCWHQWRHHGSTGIVLFRSRAPARLLLDGLLVLFAVVIGAEAVAAAWAPGLLGPLGRLPGAEGPSASALGAALVVTATALTVASQLHLGASWRIGIEEGARPGLVTGGFYRFCRNPIYLFMLVAAAGFVLLLPNWLSLGTLGASYVGFRLQVAQEEAYLLRSYGDAYRAYAREVGRFLPGLGRLG